MTTELYFLTDDSISRSNGVSFPTNNGDYLRRFFPEEVETSEFASIHCDLGLDKETLSDIIAVLREQAALNSKEEERFNKTVTDIYCGWHRKELRSEDSARYISAKSLYQGLFVLTVIEFGPDNICYNLLEDSQLNKYPIIRQIAIGLAGKIKAENGNPKDKARLEKWLDKLREFGGGNEEAKRISTMLE